MEKGNENMVSPYIPKINREIFNVFGLEFGKPIKGETIKVEKISQEVCVVNFVAQDGTTYNRPVVVEHLKTNCDKFIEEFNKQLNSK